jgi:hypothetical protein
MAEVRDFIATPLGLRRWNSVQSNRGTGDRFRPAMMSLNQESADIRHHTMDYGF